MELLLLPKDNTQESDIAADASERNIEHCPRRKKNAHWWVLQSTLIKNSVFIVV